MYKKFDRYQFSLFPTLSRERPSSQIHLKMLRTSAILTIQLLLVVYWPDKGNGFNVSTRCSTQGENILFTLPKEACPCFVDATFYTTSSEHLRAELYAIPEDEHTSWLGFPSPRAPPKDHLVYSESFFQNGTESSNDMLDGWAPEKVQITKTGLFRMIVLFSSSSPAGNHTTCITGSTALEVCPLRLAPPPTATYILGATELDERSESTGYSALGIVPGRSSLMNGF